MPPPEPPPEHEAEKTTTVRIPVSLHEWLRRYAFEQNTTQRSVIEWGLRCVNAGQMTDRPW